MNKFTIKKDKRNYRVHGDKNKSLIKKSLDELGAGRSIVTDASGEIIGGNGVFEQWGNRPIKVVETDGKELIVVKRTDLKRGDMKRRMLAVMDNSASDSSHFDKELLAEDFSPEELDNLGIEEIPIDDGDNSASSEPQPSVVKPKIEKREIRGFIKTHVLISFPPEKMIEIQDYLQKIKDTEGIEYEQASN
jgi:hypothetical protein